MKNKKLIIVLIAIVLVVLFVPLKRWLKKPSSTPNFNVHGLNGLIFQAPGDEKRMRTLDACIQTFSPSGWQYHTDYSEIGNFYEATWCNGTGCQYPNGGEAYGKRDTHRLTLSTTDYKLPQVYGVALAVDFLPAQPGWGVNFSFANGMAPTVTNDRFHINFLRYDDADGAAKEQIYVGSGDSYEIYETEIAVNSPRTLEEDLTSYTSSALKMRDLALTQLKNLRQKVASTIAANTITRCVETEQIRPNLPPRCIKRALLSEAEKTEELKKANDYFDAQVNLLNQYYQKMYEVLVKAVPLKNCLS